MAVYLIYGEEDFLLEEKLREIRAKQGPLELIDGELTESAHIIASLQSSGLFSTTRQYEVRHAPWLIEKKADEAEETLLIEILQGMAREEAVVFSVFGEIHRRGTLFKYLAKHGEVFEFPSVPIWNSRERLGFVQEQAQKYKKRFEREAAEQLVEITTGSLRQLATEVGKLVAAADPSSSISIELVKDLASPGEVYAWQFADALLEGDRAGALCTLRDLLRVGEAPVALLAILARQFRLLLKIKLGASVDGLRLSRGAARRLTRASQRFHVDTIQKLLRRLLEVDELLKRSATSPAALLGSLTLEMTADS